jgi:hypothetical protein
MPCCVVGHSASKLGCGFFGLTVGASRMTHWRLPHGLVSTAIALISLLNLANAQPLVLTTKGYVQGIVRNSVNVFNSIPFAAPPTGELRFQAPHGVKPWEGVTNVGKLPAICPQLKLDGNLALSEDEDCLYLVSHFCCSAPDSLN